VKKPTWTSSSYLVYAGGLVVLGSATGALGYLAAHYGDAAFAGWAFLVLAVLYALANGFKERGRWLTAGIFAYASVVAWGVFVGALWVWFGWLSGSDGAKLPFHGFSVARLSLELLVLASVFADLRRFSFPFIASIGVLFGWLFITDLISGGGNWSAVVTLFVGFAYFAAGSASDRPSAFWLHFAAGSLIGGSLLYWWHSGDLKWALISVASLVYVGIARRTGRSSWAVFASLGLLMAGAHFATEWSQGHGGDGASNPLTPFVSVDVRGWVPPLVFAFVGFLLVALGLSRRRAA
jgi:hypothetical protein